MTLINLNTVLFLHDLISENYRNVSTGHLNKGTLESIITQSDFTIYGHKKYDTIFKQAACIMEGIIRKHPFADGNKRTALLTARLIITNNDYYFATPPNTDDFLCRIASNTTQTQDGIDGIINEITTWLEANSKPQ